MGKSSTWIKNFLPGKREDKNRKPTVPSILPQSRQLHTPDSILPATTTPKIKRRWSFKRTTSNRSFYSNIFTPNQCSFESDAHHRIIHAAATKIQAVYRSYLARRALRALRSLVKIQALARGHLIRKRMSVVMHAILSIQVRARIHRVQMADELENITNESVHQIRGSLRSQSGRIPERDDYGSRRRHSVHVSFVSQREHQLKMCASSSTESSCTTYDGHLEEFSLQRNSRKYSPSPESKQPYANPFAQCQDYSTFKPNYMTNTESSKQKTKVMS